MTEAPVIYIPGWVGSDADAYFDCLWNDLAWQRRENAPRREYWTNTLERPYTYGRGMGERTYQPQPDHLVIQRVRDRIEREYGCFLEGRFLNGSQNERDSLGWHADDDPGIDHSKPIVVITLGQGRNIQFRSSDVSELPSTLMLEHGSALFMLPGMQDTHHHRIPKAGFAAKPRISLTFRGLLP